MITNSNWIATYIEGSIAYQSCTVDTSVFLYSCLWNIPFVNQKCLEFSNDKCSVRLFWCLGVGGLGGGDGVHTSGVALENLTDYPFQEGVIHPTGQKISGGCHRSRGTVHSCKLRSLCNQFTRNTRVALRRRHGVTLYKKNFYRCISWRCIQDKSAVPKILFTNQYKYII